jgi:hypothetical protein
MKCSLQEYILKHCIQNIFSDFQIFCSMVFIGDFLKGPVEKSFWTRGLCNGLYKGFMQWVVQGFMQWVEQGFEQGFVQGFMQWVVQGFMQWVVQGFVIRTYNLDIQSGYRFMEQYTNVYRYREMSGALSHRSFL